MQEEICFDTIFERGSERIDQIWWKITDEPDRIVYQYLSTGSLPRIYPTRTYTSTQCSKKLIFYEHTLFREHVHQR